MEKTKKNKPTDVPNGDNTQGFRLGKSRAVYDSRTLRFAEFIEKKMPTPPDVIDWEALRKWPMYFNNKYGDCTSAAAAHMIQTWTAIAKKPVTPEDNSVLDFYKHFTVPGPENGCNMLSVLKYWRRTGLGGDKIGAFAGLEPKNQVETMIATAEFGGCYIGLALPKFAVSAPDASQVPWVVPPQGPVGDAAPDSSLGHCVNAVGYDQRNLYVVTWGDIKTMSWPFYDAYSDEAYAIVTKDFLNGNKKSPDGFDMGQLNDELQQLDKIPPNRAAILHRA